jgi:hypothetical protein
MIDGINVLLRLGALLSLALFGVGALAQATQYKPGVYDWKLMGGTLELIVAKHTNRSSFDNNAYTFYFKDSNDGMRYIIPLSGMKPSETLFTTFSSAGGDWLLADLAVREQANGVNLTRVWQSSPNGWGAPGDLHIEKYLLRAGDEESLPYEFKLISRKVEPMASRISVDVVIREQLGKAIN